MHKYKFQRILDSLKYDEFKMFGKFISSPFFTESIKMKELYEFVKKYYNIHTLEKLTPERISRNFFKYETKDFQRTRKLISDFSKLLEDFLVVSDLDKDKVKKAEHLTYGLKERGLDEDYFSEMNSLKELLKSDILTCREKYNSSIKYLGVEMKSSNITSKMEDKIRKIYELFDFSKKTDIFMRLYICHILIQEDILNILFVQLFGVADLKEFLINIEKNMDLSEDKDAGIYLYYLTLKQISAGNYNELYSEIENFIENNKNKLNSEDIGFNICTLLNFVITEIYKGKSDEIKKIIDVFKRIVDRGYPDIIGEIKYFIYLNIIIIATYMKEIEFAEKFLWKYLTKVKIFKSETQNLCFAHIRFAESRYNDARDYIYRINSREYRLYLPVNSLLLKIHYEENSLKFINPLVDSLKHFLRRNKDIPYYLSDSYSLFLKYLMRITSLKKKSRKDFFKVEYELSREKNFYNKRWIEEKMSELVFNS